MRAWLLCLLALPAAAKGPLDYAPKPFEAQVEEKGRSMGGLEYEVRFPSPAPGLFPRNNTVWAHLILPEKPGAARLPCIMVLPVMAAPNIWIEERFIRRFVKEGFAVLWLEMPFQFHRRVDPSQPSGQTFLARSAPRLAGNFRQSVLDARRALDWLSRQPQVDPARIGLFGISLGGMVGSVVYSIDPKPKYAAFLLAGADFPSLAQESSMTRKFMRSAGILPEELKRAWVGIDPLDYASANKGKEVLLINARGDTVVPKANALKLLSAFPAGRQEWVALGHYTAILHLFWMPGRVAKEFLARL